MRAISYFIQSKIVPYSILCGGLSDYTKPGLNTLEIGQKWMDNYIVLECNTDTIWKQCLNQS